MTPKIVRSHRILQYLQPLDVNMMKQTSPIVPVIKGLLSSSARCGKAFLTTKISIRPLVSSSQERSGQKAVIWDRYAEKYSKQSIKDEVAYQEKLQVTQQYLKPHMNVLELGCGTGGTSIIHAPYVKHILATDISSKMLDIARMKAQDANVANVEFRQTSIDQLGLPKESYDVVLGLSILHLLKNKDDAIAKTHGWLKPGGLFVTSTACFADMGTRSKFYIKTFFSIGQLVGLLPYINFISRKELKESLIRGGFDIEYEWQPKPDAAVFLIGRKN